MSAPTVPPTGSNMQIHMEQPEGGHESLGCPPGLEYLAVLDQLLIRQEVEMFEVLTGIETKNRFSIGNRANQRCYYAYEESNCFERVCCTKARGVKMHIVDNAGYEVIRATRPFKLFAGCCWLANRNCFAQEMLVESPPGTVIGKIWQEKSAWIIKYQVLTPDDVPIFQVNSPCCPLSYGCCMCDYEFPIRDMSENPTTVAGITKTYGGFAKECCTDATNFSVKFPLDLDVKMKACLFALAFLVDLMMFERDDCC